MYHCFADFYRSWTSNIGDIKCLDYGLLFCYNTQYNRQVWLWLLGISLPYRNNPFGWCFLHDPEAVLDTHLIYWGVQASPCADDVYLLCRMYVYGVGGVQMCLCIVYWGGAGGMCFCSADVHLICWVQHRCLYSWQTPALLERTHVSLCIADVHLIYWLWCRCPLVAGFQLIFWERKHSILLYV